MITPMDVVDSAVKIGLGAIISGLATYWLAKANYNKTIEKERAQRKIAMLEVAAQQVAAFDQLANSHVKTVWNWLTFTPLGQPMSETKSSELAALEREVSDAYGELRSIKVNLKLLGEERGHQLLIEYANRVEIPRQDAIVARVVEPDKLIEYKNSFGKSSTSS